jgi:asparagine synthase (glutamine-hydrolysing)
MCGIVGIWNTDGKPLDLATVRRATSALRHRGPDDEGYLLVNTRTGHTISCAGTETDPRLALPGIEQYAGDMFDLAFGFRRLAILDLSSSGHQPMASPDQRHWIVFNGEIYNYLELRAELSGCGHRFRTGTDTEVILAAYQQWGPDCLRRFNGMWAFTLWDSAERTLFMSRDRFGVKPLYYHQSSHHQCFAFASEIKALLAAGVVPFRPSPLAVASYIAFGDLPSPSQGDTFFQEVHSLPGSHFGVLSSGQFARSRYWAVPPPASAPAASRADIQAQYRDLFMDAVRIRLRADVPIGTTLSGGLDSSSIVAVAGHMLRTEHTVALERLGEHQQTFSAVYTSNGYWNEREHIDKVLAATGAAGNFVFPTAERLQEELRRLVWHQDEPFQSTSMFSQYCVMGLAREQGVTVLLDGQGADEVLAGYHTAYSVYLRELLGQKGLVPALKAAWDIRTVTSLNTVPLVLGEIVRQFRSRRLLQSLEERRRDRFKQMVATSGLSQPLKDQLFSKWEMDLPPKLTQNPQTVDDLLAGWLKEEPLPHLLRYEDRNSMAFSIEARLPFLDYRLVEFVFERAGALRIQNGWTKSLHRDAVQDLLPADITWRKDKLGFATPQQQWLSDQSGVWQDLIEQKEADAGFLDLAKIRTELRHLIQDASQNHKIWRWLCLTAWMLEYKGLA